MAKVDWPPAEKRSLIGKRIDRVDGPQKSTGAAKYSFDINRPGMLWAKLVTSPHAFAEVVRIDDSEAKQMPGVKGTYIEDFVATQQLPDKNKVQYVGQIVAAVAAETEEQAIEAARHVKVTYKPLPHQVVDTDPGLSKARESKRENLNVDDALSKAAVVVEGEYGIPVITHCCLESHGQVTELKGADLQVWPSTQNVSGYANGLGDAVGVTQNNIQVDCQYMGGGFGSKFNFDQWGKIGGVLTKQTGRPVKLMLERDQELMGAGSRPSAYAKIKVGATKEGVLTAFDALIWGTSGVSGSIPTQQMPYVFDKRDLATRIVGKAISTNRGSARAWRAPNHPQECFLTMAALEDLAAKLKMDALEFYLKNLHLTARPDVYKQELEIAAQMIDYKKKAHLRGDSTPGPIKRGIGIAMHTWGGMGHASECDVTINPDGSVEAKLGSQDLGTGNRTAIGIVVAETLGIPFQSVTVRLGKNEYSRSGGSGGSTTIGGVSVSSRQAATDALNALFDVIAPKLGVAADNLEAVEGKIRQIDKPSKSITWKKACSMLGTNQIVKRGKNVPADSQKAKLIDAGVGGVQMADVSVDIETGVVTINEMVAVQDCGLIIDLKTAESQVYGALIMGVAYSLFEEALYDAKTGRMLNADMEFYRLAGLKDVGKLKVHMMTGKGYDERGVIGLGEPPVISPGAAIGNAVANACGVRVPNLPLTPDRVIAALQKGGVI